MKVWVSENQQGLFDRTESRSCEYHEQNPEIFEWFCRFTFEKIEKGATHLGSKMIVERIRFESPVNAKGDPYKINNNMTAFYSRLFMERYPAHAGIFETRTAKADVEIA